jgi:hypoxia up-regulated 1
MTASLVRAMSNEANTVAINYGTTRNFGGDPQYHLIYDMGAGSTTATIISFQSKVVKSGKMNKTVIELGTHGFGFDRELGGELFTTRLVDRLIDLFRKSKSGSRATTDIQTNGRAMARLYKEASRVKQVLSANTETHASVSLFLVLH